VAREGFLKDKRGPQTKKFEHHWFTCITTSVKNLGICIVFHFFNGLCCLLFNYANFFIAWYAFSVISLKQMFFPVMLNV